MQGFQLVMNFLVMPIFFLSGALFPLANLPIVMTVITHLDPLTYGVDGLRGSLTGLWHFNMALQSVDSRDDCLPLHQPRGLRLLED